MNEDILSGIDRATENCTLFLTHSTEQSFYFLLYDIFEIYIYIITFIELSSCFIYKKYSFCPLAYAF